MNRIFVSLVVMALLLLPSPLMSGCGKQPGSVPAVEPPATQLNPEPAPVPEPAATYEPVPIPEPAPIVEPMPVPQPAPAPEPAPDSEPAPAPEPAPDSEPSPTPEPNSTSEEFAPVPGKTLADLTLQQDVRSMIAIFEMALYHSTAEPEVVDTKVTQPISGKGEWAERWTIGCQGVKRDYDVKFTPDPKGGTYFSVKLVK
jgi:outer membrane biosynthesis protein TonB